MKLINKSDLNDDVQYACTYEYSDKIFAFTFKLDGKSHHIMDEDGEFLDQDYPLSFGDDSKNIQYWEI